MDGIFEIFERHSGRIDRLDQIFSVAAKSWEERKTISNLLDHQFFPAVRGPSREVESGKIAVSAVDFGAQVAAIAHERDGFGDAVRAEDLPGLTLTRDVFDEALDRCPELLDEFVAQCSHEAITKHAITHDMGADPARRTARRPRSPPKQQPGSPGSGDEEDDDMGRVELPADQLIDVHGHIRPRGKCRNSLINWSNRPAGDAPDIM